MVEKSIQSISIPPNNDLSPNPAGDNTYCLEKTKSRLGDTRHSGEKVTALKQSRLGQKIHTSAPRTLAARASPNYPTVKPNIIQTNKHIRPFNFKN